MRRVSLTCWALAVLGFALPAIAQQTLPPLQVTDGSTTCNPVFTLTVSSGTLSSCSNNTATFDPNSSTGTGSTITAAASTSGTTFRDSPSFSACGTYWDGDSSESYCSEFYTDMTAVTPTGRAIIEVNDSPLLLIASTVFRAVNDLTLDLGAESTRWLALYVGAVYPQFQTVAFSATPTWNVASGSVINQEALTGNITPVITQPPGTPIPAPTIVVLVRQDGTGGRTITYPANAVGPALTAGADNADLLYGTWISNAWYFSIARGNFTPM